MHASTLNVLFLGPRNATRSIMAEAIATRIGAPAFHAFSAGYCPEGELHPYTLDLLRLQDYELQNLRCKSWFEFARTFARPHAPELDFVFLLSEATDVTMPPWPGQPLVARWAIPDPARIGGNEAERRYAFAECHRLLYQRISVFLSLPFASLNRLALHEQVALIARRIDETAA